MSDALAREIEETIENVEAHILNLQDSVRLAAEAKHEYHRRHARAYVQADGKNAGEKEANAQLSMSEGISIADWKYKAELAEGTREGHKEALRASLSILSAWQTLAGLERAEAEFARVGPGP